MIFKLQTDYLGCEFRLMNPILHQSMISLTHSNLTMDDFEKAFIKKFLPLDKEASDENLPPEAKSAQGHPGRVIKIPAREFVDRRRNKSSKFPVADACLNWTHASLELYRSSRGFLAVLPSNVRNSMSSKSSCYFLATGVREPL